MDVKNETALGPHVYQKGLPIGVGWSGSCRGGVGWGGSCRGGVGHVGVGYVGVVQVIQWWSGL